MILVIGDAMLDRHIHGTTDRMSPEAPVPVVIKDKDKWALGAAANVAAHVTSAGVPCTLMYKGCEPDEEDSNRRNYDELNRMCLEEGIVSRILEMDGQCPVTVKTRIWSNGQQVCRIDEEDVAKPSGAREAGRIKQICTFLVMHRIDVVVFSDYDKGTLTDSIIYNVAKYCLHNGIPTILDPKRGTFHNIGDLTIVKPNVRELRATGLTALECSARMGETWLVNTLGKDGMAVYRDGEVALTCPTFAEEVVDVCGCGDTVTALLALALCGGKGIEHAVAAANKGASLTIRHRGCYVPTSEEIERCLGA